VANYGPGIFVGQNSNLLFKLGTVDGNAINGVSLTENSAGRFESGSITNNTGLGIWCGPDGKKYENPTNFSGNTSGYTNCP